MDTHKLAKILMSGGIALCFAALAWWGIFYLRLIKELGGTMKNIGEAIPCLYSSGGPCGLVSGLAQMSGHTPYTPILFWVAVVMFIVGLVVSFSANASTSQEKHTSD